MSSHGVAGDEALGFLSVVEAPPGGGVVGALLVLNPRGRPLEFHCTSPVQPNRSQVILYGSTLRPFLWGEQIGVTLLHRARSRLSVTFADVPDLLAARDQWSSPLLYVLPKERTVSAAMEGLVSGPMAGPVDPTLGLEVECWHGTRCGVEPRHASDLSSALQCLADWPRLDLYEPFQRLRDAIDETIQPRSSQPCTSLPLAS